MTAFLFVSWLWIGAAVSLALLVGYLSYLRRQVRIEAAIRQKRMERLQRARQIRPEYARPQRRTTGPACRPSPPAARSSTSMTTIPGSTISRNTVSR